MARTVGAVIAGYAALAAWVFLTLTLAFSLLGANFAYEPGTLRARVAWSAVALVLSFLGALLGGRVSVAIDKREDLRAPKILAAIVLALGLAMAASQLGKQPPPLPKPVEQMEPMEMGKYTKSPDAYNFGVPIVGALGVLLGAKLRRDTLAQANA